MALDGVVVGGRDGVLDGRVSQKDMSVSQNMQCLTFRGFQDITFCVVSRKKLFGMCKRIFHWDTALFVGNHVKSINENRPVDAGKQETFCDTYMWFMNYIHMYDHIHI